MCRPAVLASGLYKPCLPRKETHSGALGLVVGKRPHPSFCSPQAQFRPFGRLGASDNSPNARTGVKFFESKSQLHHEFAV